MANAIDTVKVGRVFFKPESGPNVEKVIVLTLDSHVGNVVRLTKQFDPKYFKVDCSETREWLIRASQKHDDAKPETFRIIYRGWKENGPKSLGYSFAGHRFRVSDDNRYVELLIRLHHEFSVTGIVEAQAQLEARKQEGKREFTDTAVRNFPIDLYILEMCDQIEAELETYAFTDDVQPRVFMDFHSRKREDKIIEVSPYPFDSEDIPVSLAYYEFEVCKEHRRQISKALIEDNQGKGVNFLREMIVNAHNKAECQRKEMILCKTQ